MKRMAIIGQNKHLHFKIKLTVTACMRTGNKSKCFSYIEIKSQNCILENYYFLQSTFAQERKQVFHKRILTARAQRFWHATLVLPGGWSSSWLLA